MPQTHTITTYKFNELSAEAQKVAIDKNREINFECGEWWDNTYYDAAQIGLKIKRFDIDRGSYCEGEFTIPACEVAQNILNEHGDMCETFKTAQNFLNEWQPVFNDYMDEDSEHYESSESEDKLQDMEDQFKRSLCEDYRIILQKDCEYLYSDEAVKETLICNEYDFLITGKKYIY